ncbi:jg17426 [Pararge aegeria aegeria]|uniref:Jg17426 protein n=1 Tax=Pararge aegeria aegeria TaxID=348720 RepID=A0A8S4S6A7_9NEOP|nr:jg17426 [Pararge aegeria aegeria]
MRASAAILFFAAWPCFIHAQNTRSRENSPNFANGINENLSRLVPCVKNLGLSKCMGAYGAWRAERSLEADVHEPLNSERFPWQRFYNVSDDTLYEKLCDATERLLQRRALKLHLNQEYSLQLGVTGNGSLNVDVLKGDIATGRSSMKKFEKYFYELVPFILLPGLLMSAVLPFLLPTLKMMTIGAGMLNNMALTGAVFTLLRNNAFNDKYEKKVIYLNNGYLNDKYEPLADSPSEFVVEGDFDKFRDKFPEKFAAVESNDFNIHGPESLDANYQISSDWLKQITGKDDVKIFRNNFVGNDWRKQYDVGKDSEWVGKDM